MREFQVTGHASSLVPEGMDWKLVWADEFDGSELDRTKWGYRLEMMHRRHKTWTDDAVQLDGNSNAVFRIYEKDGEVYSSQLQTGSNFMDPPALGESTAEGLVWPVAAFREQRFLHSFGYYECRCRLQRHRGWWSAFWLQSPTIGCSPDTASAGVEMDIMESFQPGEVIEHCLHYDGYGEDHKMVTAGQGRRQLDLDGWHRFGMLWDEKGYTFYIDGEEDGQIAAPLSRRPQFILISTEVNGYRTRAYAPTEEARQAAAAGDTFLVDYVRVFDRAGQP